MTSKRSGSSDNMAESVRTENDSEDFNVISKQYKECMEKTSIDIGKSWFRYMGKENAAKEKRRRHVLQTLPGCVHSWRYMADCSEVVLGSWEMLEHEPLYLIVNKINWADPDSDGFSLLTKELNSLMNRVSKQIHDAATKARDEVIMMEIELLERGLLKPDSKDDSFSTSEDGWDDLKAYDGVSTSDISWETNEANGGSTMDLNTTDDEEWRAYTESMVQPESSKKRRRAKAKQHLEQQKDQEVDSAEEMVLEQIDAFDARTKRTQEKK